MIDKLSDYELHQTILGLRQSEKATVKSLLQHLRVVRQRKLFCDYGCSSLHVYCVKILDYSDSEAWARVKTLDLIEDKPTLELEIDKKLNLTNAASLQQLFEVADYDEEKKDFLIKKSLGKSTREVKSMIAEVAIADGLKKELEKKDNRRKTGIDTKISLTLDSNNLEHLNFLKSKLKITSDQELIEYLLQEKRSEVDEGMVEVKAHKTKTHSLPRSISPSKKHLVYKNASSKCENCGSVFNLNIDHIKPVGIGGSNDLLNLRLLCHHCNQRSGIKVFGINKMKEKTSKTPVTV